MHRRFALVLAMTAALAGCARFPALEATVSDEARAAPYPDLVPVEQISAQVSAPRVQEPGNRALAVRAARLRARAAQLRGSVIDPAEQDRLRRGVE